MRDHLEVEFFLTILNMDIILRKVDEPEPVKLPYNIFIIRVGEKLVFVRKTLGRLMPVSQEEQLELSSKYLK